MAEPQKSILQKSVGLFMCKDELEAAIRLEELFPSDNITFYIPSNHFISKEELGKNTLYKYFESDDTKSSSSFSVLGCSPSSLQTMV